MIHVRALTKRYADGKQALAGIDLELDDGLLGVLGPNGAGKTTLLSCLVLALEPTAGTIRYDELDRACSAHHAAIRRRIGYLPQDFSPIRALTGLEYLEHCARLRGVAPSAILPRARELLGVVGLGHTGNRPSGTYSGGMRRRLGIAQALIHAPRLLVVDEPTSGLDPEERMSFRNLMSEVALDTTVLLSTHIAEDVEAICPRLVVVAAGKVLFDGSPQALLRAARGVLWRIAGVSDAEATVPVIAHRRGEDGAPYDVVMAPEPPPGATPHPPTLEEAYSAFLSRAASA